MDEGLIDRIYECAFVPEAWPGLLDDISLLAGADAAGMVAVNSAKFRWTCSERLCGPMQFALGDGAFFRSPFNARALETHYDGFKHASELATSDELAGDPMFRDVFRPAGLDGGVGTMVQASTGDKLLLFTLDAIERETPDDKAIARLDVLRPHLARSMLTSARLELERARAAAQALDMLGLPALVFGHGGKVVAANSAIEALEGLIHWRAADRIAFADAAADALFQQGLAALDNPGAPATRSFAVRSMDGRAAMVGHVVPVRRSARDIFSQSSGVLMLTPLTVPDAPAVELVQSLFDLTPAEARVARSLTAGQSVGEIAAGSGLANCTIRTHVRAILEKTGCKRQVEVVALLGGIVAPLG